MAKLTLKLVRTREATRTVKDLRGYRTRDQMIAEGKHGDEAAVDRIIAHKLQAGLFVFFVFLLFVYILRPQSRSAWLPGPSALGGEGETRGNNPPADTPHKQTDAHSQAREGTHRPSKRTHATHTTAQPPNRNKMQAGKPYWRPHVDSPGDQTLFQYWVPLDTTGLDMTRVSEVAELSAEGTPSDEQVQMLNSGALRGAPESNEVQGILCLATGSLGIVPGIPALAVAPAAPGAAAAPCRTARPPTHTATRR